MGRTAILFPGEGSQSPRMRDTVAAVRPDLPAFAVQASGRPPMMKPAVPEFVAALERVKLHPARVPVLSAVSAAPFDDVRRRLAEGLTMPVRWRETMLALHRLGVERFVEVGPGRVLTGLVKRTLSDLEPIHA